jgi:hypothetical protein
MAHRRDLDYCDRPAAEVQREDCTVPGLGILVGWAD